MTSEIQAVAEAGSPSQKVAVPKASPAAVGGLVVGAVTFALLALTKLFTTVSVSGQTVDDNLLAVLGVLGLLTLLPILATIVLGHIGVSATSRGKKRGRAAAGAALALGYVLLTLSIVRLVNALVATAAYSGDNPLITFLSNIFWWA